MSRLKSGVESARAATVSHSGTKRTIANRYISDLFPVYACKNYASEAVVHGKLVLLPNSGANAERGSDFCLARETSDRQMPIAQIETCPRDAQPVLPGSQSSQVKPATIIRREIL